MLFAISTTFSTIFNIIEHVYYLANWHELRIAQYETTIAIYNKPGLAVGPLSRGTNAVLFWIVLCLYNVDAMLLLFWYASRSFRGADETLTLYIGP